MPEATSASTPTTRADAAAAHRVSRLTCRSRSARWSWEDTRAYNPSPPSSGGLASAADWTKIVPEGVCSAGTGSLPSRNHFHAVW